MADGENALFPTGPLTPEQDLLVEGTSRAQCFTCRSARLRPLIVLAMDGFPPQDSRHNIGYSHDAIFGCEECHHGYVELRRHDCFDFEELYDQDHVCALDGDSVANLVKCLPGCPQPLAETCKCKVHESLRSSFGWLPSKVWDRYTGELPGVLLQLADADKDRLVLSGIWVEVRHGVPKLAAKDGHWRETDARGILKAEGKFRNGLLHARWVFWHANGRKKAEGEYSNDLREGKWVEWNDRGEVVAVQEFRQGKSIK